MAETRSPRAGSTLSETQAADGGKKPKAPGGLGDPKHLPERNGRNRDCPVGSCPKESSQGGRGEWEKPKGCEECVDLKPKRLRWM